jgi:hypothetical protein
VDFDLLFRYFTTSLDAVNEGPTDDFELSIANSVIWACILDEALTARLRAAYKSARDSDRSGRVLDGLRLARNAIVHGQTFAIQPEGMPYPIDYPLFYGPPLWKSYDELTRDWTPWGSTSAAHLQLREVYEHEIAGSNIGAPLWTAREWLDGMHERRWSL